MTMTHTTFDTLARQGSPFGCAGAFTVAKAAEHGARMDEFHAVASNDHGPYFDAGFSQGAADDAHGKLFDLFGVPRDSDAHGQRWDEFDWREMPALHGAHFDTGFATPIAGEGEHGTTWFDVFRGGRTQARYIFNGVDHEGTVVDVAPEYATVQSRDGQTHEVELTQFLAYRTPNEEQAGPAIPASDAEAPSARSSDAHGAFEGERADVSPEVADKAPIEAIPQGQARQARSDLLGGPMDTFDHVKTLARGLDVAKRFASAGDVIKAIRYDEVGDGSPVVYRAPNGSEIQGTIELYLNGVYGVDTGDGVTMLATGENLDLAKSVAKTWSSGTAFEAKKPCGKMGCDSHTMVAHANKAGSLIHCGQCGSVHPGSKFKGETHPEPEASAAIGKTVTLRDELADVFKDVGITETAILGTPNQAGIDVPVREHKSTDHHSSVDSPKVCPHCGKPLAEEEHQTEQGAPSRKDKEGGSDEFDTVESHKCFGSTLDLLKSLVPA